MHRRYIALLQTINSNSQVLSKPLILNLPYRVGIRMKSKNNRLRIRQSMQSLALTAQNCLNSISTVFRKERGLQTWSIFSSSSRRAGLSSSLSSRTCDPCTDPKAANNSVSVVTLQLTLLTNLPTSTFVKNRSILRSSLSAYPGTGVWISAKRKPSFSRVLKPDGKHVAYA